MEGQLSSKVDSQTSSKGDSQNSRKRKGQKSSKGEGQKSSKMEGQKSSKMEGQLSSKGEGQNSSNGEDQKSSKGEGRKRTKEEGQKSSKMEGQKSSKMEGQLSSKGDSQTSSKGDSQNSSKRKGQNSSKGEGQKSSKMEGQLSSKGDSQLSSKGEGQNSSNVEGENSSNVEDQKSSKGEGQKSSKMEGQKSSKGEGQTSEQEDRIKGLEKVKTEPEGQTIKVEDLTKGVEDLTRKLEVQHRGPEKYIKGQNSDVQKPKTSSSVSVKVKTGPVETSPSASRTSGRDVLFLMGGYFCVNTVETLDPALDSWVSHKVPDSPSLETWICSWGHKVLVLETDNERLRSLDVPTRKWTQLQYLPQHRYGYTVVFSDDQVYLLGGKEPHGTSCDRYDAQTDRWDETAPMREGRTRAAAVYHAGKLYCTGGLSVPGRRVLSSMEVMDPQRNGQWASLTPTGVGRFLHSMASCGRFLWAIGGRDGKTILSDVEKYDVVEQRWSRVRPLNEPRSTFSASVFGGRVQVMGGVTTGDKAVRTVEVYDEETDRWASAAPLQKERCWHSSCLVRYLPDADADKLAVPIE